MLFNSMHFIVFFILIVTLYFSIAYRYRWILLLTASYYFYMCWKLEYIVLIFASTVVDYFCGLKIFHSESKTTKKYFLLLSLIVNLGLLFSFKYYNFFSDSIRAAFETIDLTVTFPHLNVLLPVGISFYTFQTLSYTIEIYRGNMAPERHFGIFALFVSFFPQLVAGPVERANNLIPQLKTRYSFDAERVKSGLKLMLLGFYKKIVVADSVGIYVNQVYNNCYDYEGWQLIIATILFAFQIYGDFSGYSDIAIGAARVMGYDLLTNFRFPLFAKSVPDYWRRWHISMSTWFKDYIFIPLGGNRCKKWRWYFNIFIVFFLSGFWHGANWTFVIWGMIHGIYMISSIATKSLRRKFRDQLNVTPFIQKGIRIFIAFNLVAFSRIFFRGNSVEESWYILTHLCTDLSNFSGLSVSIGKYTAVVSFLAALSLVLVELVQINYSKNARFNRLPIGVRWSFYFAMIFIIIIFGVDYNTQFIYFQF
ncbi:MBOAT family protein [candidate division KSB1 bacterium]|nr:MBOAT family protein [candidate division KSB1 bacterium]